MIHYSKKSGKCQDSKIHHSSVDRSILKYFDVKNNATVQFMDIRCTYRTGHLPARPERLSVCTFRLCCLKPPLNLSETGLSFVANEDGGKKNEGVGLRFRLTLSSRPLSVDRIKTGRCAKEVA
jgi:hypothetical protein